MRAEQAIFFLNRVLILMCSFILSNLWHGLQLGGEGGIPAERRKYSWATFTFQPARAVVGEGPRRTPRHLRGHTGGEQLVSIRTPIPKQQQVCRHASAGGLENDWSAASGATPGKVEWFTPGIATTALACSRRRRETGAHPGPRVCKSHKCLML